MDPDPIRRRIGTARFTLFASGRRAAKQALPRSAAAMPANRHVSLVCPGVPPVLHEWLLRPVPDSPIVQVFSAIDLLDAAIASGRGPGVQNLRLAAETPGKLPCFDPIPELEMQHLLLVPPEAWRRREVKASVRFFAPRYAALYR